MLKLRNSVLRPTDALVRQVLCGASLISLISASGVAHAQQATPEDNEAIDTSEIVVTADKVGLLEKKPSSTVLGFDKPLLETARSATLISDDTISRYGIESVDALVAIAPGTFSNSNFGVAGSLSVRGTPAENYFQGFKLIDNLGTYKTPLAAASRVDIVRGPPSPIYGAGKVGGFLNIAPKTARSGANSSPTGSVSATYGGYNRYQFSGELGLPFKMGDTDAGLYTYVEYDHGDEYFRGISPERITAQASFTLDMPGGWSFELDGMLYHATGETQTPGWNRLTQALVDDGIYITGRNDALTASPGATYLTPVQTIQGGGVVGSPGTYPALAFTNASGARGNGLTYVYNGATLTADGRFPLTSGVGTTKLDRRTIYIGNNDFSETTVPTIYSSLRKTFDNENWLKLEGFFSYLNNKRFVSYGYPAWVRTGAAEVRLTYRNKTSAFDDKLKVETIIGVGDRYVWGHDMQSFNSGVIALDRRDISAGPTPTDSICSPFEAGIADNRIPANCLGWESDVHSTTNNYGAFLTSDIELYDRLALTIGGRYDHYDVKSRDSGILSFTNGNQVTDSANKFTYMASLSYKTPFGIMPYITYAKSSSLQFSGGGAVLPNQITNRGWIRDSKLKEVGFKYQLFNGTFVGSFAYYEQERPLLSGLPPAVLSVNTVGKGAELEMRWLASSNLSFTFAGNIQTTKIEGPDSTVVYVPSSVVCGQNAACLTSLAGGALRERFTLLPGRAGDYTYTPIPRKVWSLYANYVTDEHDWGKAGVTWGVTYASKTSGLIPDPVVYPGYYVSNLSAFYRKGPWELTVNINNLFDKLYFTPASGVYVNLAALPSKGRLWRATIKRSF